jgi:hypothetical protein
MKAILEVLHQCMLISFFSPYFCMGQDNNELLSYIKTTGKGPAAYVVEKFKTQDIVLLGEDHRVQQNLLFVQSLIPALYANGIFHIGMEFGASEDQALLDSLISAPVYSEDVARRIMFHYNVAWAFREYRDLYKKAWEFNRTLPFAARKFRIINLSYYFIWEGFEAPRTPENMALVFHKGTADKYRAELIEREIFANGEKMLALVGTPHAYTKYANGQLLYNNDNFCSYDNNWLGNRLLRNHPGKVFSILLHQPFPNKYGRQPYLLSPAHGTIEDAMQQLKNQPIAFDLFSAPATALRDDSYYSICYPDFTLVQFFDGYIFLAPINELKSCTIDEDFITAANIDQALKESPDPDWHGRQQTLEEFKEFVRSKASIEKRYAGVGGD